MRFLIVFLICLFLGCVHTGKSSIYTPPYLYYPQHVLSGDWTFTQSGNGYSDEDVALYTSVFLELWKYEDFPQDAVKCIEAFNKIEINWQTAVFTYENPADGTTRLLGLTYRGLKPGKILVFVATSPHGKALTIDQSAYGHELIHIALAAITGDAHPEHFQKEDSSDWPPKYEDFLVKVSKEFVKRSNENKRTDRAIAEN